MGCCVLCVCVCVPPSVLCVCVCVCVCTCVCVHVCVYVCTCVCVCDMTVHMYTLISCMHCLVHCFVLCTHIVFSPSPPLPLFPLPLPPLNFFSQLDTSELQTIESPALLDQLIKKAFDVTGAKPTEESDKTLEGKQTSFVITFHSDLQWPCVV